VEGVLNRAARFLLRTRSCFQNPVKIGSGSMAEVDEKRQDYTARISWKDTLALLSVKASSGVLADAADINVAAKIYPVGI